MKITIEVDHDWQAKLIRDLTGLITAEHPLAGSVHSVCLGVNLKFEDGSANGYLHAALEGQDPEMEVYQLIHLGALALGRVEHIVTTTGGEKDIAGSLFFDGVRRLANEHTEKNPPSESTSVDEAMAKARKWFHRSNPR